MIGTSDQQHMAAIIAAPLVPLPVISNAIAALIVVILELGLYLVVHETLLQYKLIMMDVIWLVSFSFY